MLRLLGQSTVWGLAALLTMGICTATPSAAAASAPVIFAMGNSYLSGQGADNYRTIPADLTSYLPGTTGPDNYCFRSRFAAVELVAKRVGARLTNVTCANSQPQHMDSVAQFNEGVQLSHLPPTADVVVMQVIGNPEFIKVIGCVQLRECDQPTVARSLKVLDTSQRLHERRIVAAVHRSAPRAKVLIVGAPQVVPRVGQDQRARCGWFMSTSEVRQLNSFIGKINEVSSDTARRTGATFVDLARLGSPWNQRHDLCSTDPWEWGPRVAAPQYPGDNLSVRNWTLGSYHPTIAGQRGTAAVLEGYVREALR